MPSWEFYIITFVLLLLQSYPALPIYVNYWLFSRLWVNFVLDFSCIIRVCRNEGSRQPLTLSSFSVCHRWREPPVQRAHYSQDSLFLMTEQGKGINAQPFQFNAGKQFSRKKSLRVCLCLPPFFHRYWAHKLHLSICLQRIKASEVNIGTGLKSRL